MKANLYISVCLLLGIAAYAQNDNVLERADNTPPAVTIAGVEQNAKEAAEKNNDYYNPAPATKPDKQPTPVQKSEKEKNATTVVVTNTTVNASTKPEKQ